jgi:hypothetical protein
MTLTLCAAAIPSFSALLAGAASRLSFPPALGLQMPTLPTLPNPLYPNYLHPNLQITIVVEELQTYQILTTMMAIIQPLASFLGATLSSILPTIVGTGLTLVDLLANQAANLYAAVSAAIQAGEGALFSLVPNPIFPSYLHPEMALVVTVRLVIKQYMFALIGLMQSLISSATSIMKVANMVALPAIPTLSQLTGALFAVAGAGIATIDELLHAEAASLQSLVASLSFPGLVLPVLPIPLVPNFHAPDIEFTETLNIIYAQFATTVLQIIYNFVNSLPLTFVYPVICITF